MKTNMVRCVTEIGISASPESHRDIKMTFNFVNEFEAADTWVDLTNQARIVFPKNFYVRDEWNRLFPLGGTNSSKYIDYLFRRGDSVTINYGYYTYDELGREFLDMPADPVFTGYISKVNSKIPIELECEDNMWLLKQIPCKPQVWPKNKSVEELLKSLLVGTDFSVSASENTNVGSITIQKESVAQLLVRLQKDYGLESYFKNNELRIGFSIYKTEEAKEHTFIFQQNIISDNLEFQRKDDVKLSAVVTSNIEKVEGTNKKGQQKTKTEKIELLVYNEDDVWKFEEKQAGQNFPENLEGERRSLNYVNVTDKQVLFERAKNDLTKYYYTGFKGTFTTFAIPLVRVGDHVTINDPILPDRNGKYVVKCVKYTGGINGHRQEIELHYKL